MRDCAGSCPWRLQSWHLLEPRVGVCLSLQVSTPPHPGQQEEVTGSSSQDATRVTAWEVATGGDGRPLPPAGLPGQLEIFPKAD